MTLLVVAGCAPTDDAPAASTTTVKPPAVTVIATAAALPAVTVTQAINVPTTAIATAKANPSDMLAYGVVVKGLAYVDGVKVNYDKHDGSAPLEFLQDAAQQAQNTFDLVNNIYLNNGVNSFIKSMVDLWNVRVGVVQNQTVEESTSTIEAIEKYLEAASQLRATCEGTIG